MKERPILFNGEMVRALIAGTKTQTRRVVKPQPGLGNGMVNAAYCGHPNVWLPTGSFTEANPSRVYHCPFGQPGDRLWMRETWYCDHFEVQRGPYREVPGAKDLLVFHADNPRPYEAEQPVWRPSIHMPRWASRLTLNITAVRVERLNDISEADAKAEGVSMPDASDSPTDTHHTPPKFWSYKQEYAYLWDEINGPGSWALNPWVWVIEFRRVEK